MKFFSVILVVCTLASDFMVLGYELSSLVLDQDRPTLRCKNSKAYSLIQVDCSGGHFEGIPNNLDTSVQALVLTNNRLRNLPPGSFSRYRSLEYLYLGTNLILNLSNETIEELPYLQVLDLSDNVLQDLSPALFQLPYLRRLYLSNSELKDFMINSEVTSPLELLVLSRNHLKKIPSIGPQAALLTFNVSRNDIGHISTEDLAPFCALRTLDLTYNPIKFNLETCECYHFNSWIRIRNIKVKPAFPCDNATFDECSRVPFSNQTMESFTKCLNIIEVHAAAQKARSTWITVGCCVGAFIVCAIIGFYCLHKRNKKRNRKIKEEQRRAANNANTELLNGNLPDRLSAKTLQE